ncbi:transcriptional regulator NrdR [Parvularcula maris]|uniref:Transcriptional repressor NrdR n=1 Tax=Parvularcula maris TaxID=2965077 RepID=A0A9X2RHS2_9PROT|nr:transcriptional regulator NrdR [Parvularcula maris]MCQ8185220.1 transcriptional regulator NrdR [Parvularcula maris]
MRCPFCQSDDTQVKDSRPADDGTAIRRRRLCGSCEARFTTFERVQLRELTVLKSSGRKAAFDRDKVTRSIQIATRKRDIDQDTIERTVSQIVRSLEQSGETEIESRAIGAAVMSALRDIDDVAFVRYASVYKNFTEASDFEGFLRELSK